MKYKKTISLLLALVILIGSFNFVFADDEKIGDNIGSKDQNEEKFGSENWTRPYDHFMGLDKNGKNIYGTSGGKFGNSYTYQQWMAIMANWAGLSYKPHLYGDDFYEQGIAIDRDTTEEKFREPKIEYDVIVIDADNNPTVYSGFGFKAKEMYDEIMRIQGEKPNISLSNPDCPKVDVSQYFQNLGEKFYFDISFGNGQGGSNQPIFQAPVMGKIKMPARIYMIDYSSVGGDSSIDFKDNDFQIGAYKKDKDGKVVIAGNDNTVYRFKTLGEKGPGILLGDKLKLANFTWAVIDVEGFKEGSRIATYVNRSVNTNLKDKDTGNSMNSRGFIPISTGTNVRIKGADFAMGKYQDPTKTLISDWYFQTYMFEVGESEPELQIIKFHPPMALIPPYPKPDNPPINPPNNPPDNPPVTPPEKPGENPPLPPDTKITIEVEVGYPDDSPDGDKGTGTVKDPDDIKKPDGKKRKPVTPVIDVNIKSDNPDGNKGTATVKAPDEIPKPGKRTTKIPVEVKTGKPGTEVTVCAKINPQTFPDGKLSEEQKKEHCQTFKVGQGADIGIAEDVKVSGDGVDTNKNTYKKGAQLTIDFKAKHFAGEKEVGTGTEKDPRINVTYEIKDSKGNVIKQGQNELTSPLQKGGEAPIPSISFKADTDFFTACAKIDPKHAKLGQNIANNNDETCVTYKTSGEEIKNYAVRDVMVTPSSYTLGDNKTSEPQDVKVSFTIANESAGGQNSKPLPDGVKVKIIYGGKTKTVDLSVGPGQTVNHTETIKMNLTKGGKNPNPNDIKIIVNEARNPKEETPGRDPYADNVKTATVYVYSFAEGCPKDKSAYARGVNKRNENFKTPVRYGVDFKTSGYVTYEWLTEEQRWGCKREEYVNGTRWDYGFGCLRKNAWGQCLEWGYGPIQVPTKELKCVEYGWIKEYKTHRADGFVKDAPARSTFGKEVAFEDKIDVKPMFRSKLTYDLAKVPVKGRNDDNPNGWVELKGDNGKIKNGYGLELKYEYKYNLKTKNGRTLNQQVERREAEQNMKDDDARQALRNQAVPQSIINQARNSGKLVYGPYPTYNAWVQSKTYQKHASQYSLADMLGNRADTNAYAHIPKLSPQMKDKNCIKLDRYKESGPEGGDRTEVTKTIDFRLPVMKSPDGKTSARKIFVRLNQPAKLNGLAVTIRDVVGLVPARPNKKPLRWPWEETTVDVKANDDIKTHIIR